MAAEVLMRNRCIAETYFWTSTMVIAVYAEYIQIFPPGVVVGLNGMRCPLHVIYCI